MPIRSRPTNRVRMLAIALVIGSLALFFAPATWRDPLFRLTGCIAPLQTTATSAADGALSALGIEGNTDPSAEGASLETQALLNQVAALAARVVELERERETLLGIRQWSVAGGSIGSKGRLIPARVLTDDLTGWRSSTMVDAGTSRGVHRSAPVASRYFTVDKGAPDGVADGLGVLVSEVLVGFIDHAGASTSRVQLLSDPASRLRVLIGGFVQSADGNEFRMVNQAFLLEGQSRGRMLISDVPRRLVDENAVQRGQVVLADSSDGRVPVPLIVGSIVDITTNPSNPLLCSLSISSPVDESHLTRVFVFNPETASLP